ncbi:MAG: AAA family ATPase [Candidatus Pacebacteria bacterium]|nr:AAA family ATPase [Candidatus Paceibacterota bacterium]NUQ57610.1 AAA family ATPase [Candidatus Paceibacter sp.]
MQEKSFKEKELLAKKCFIGGVSGVGKSTFLEKLEELYDCFEIIHGSKYFMRWLGLKEGDYHSLQSMDDNIKNKELNKMMRFILAAKQKNKTLLVDAHYLRIKEGKISDATDDWAGLFDGLFVLEDEPEKILARIKSDSMNLKRNRKIFPVPENSDDDKKIKLLRKYHNRTVEKVKKLSNKFNIPYFIIKNKDGKVEEVAREFVGCVKLINCKL